MGRRGNFGPHGRDSIRELLDLASSRSPGPVPSFTGSHILLLFLNISRSAYVGRGALAKQSGLGEGATRTVLRRLKEKGYVDTIKSGCFLTPAGKLACKSIASWATDVVTVPRSELTMGEHQTAVALKGAGGSMRLGIEQRDSAIRVGAAAATTYIIQSGRFTIPGGSTNCEKDFPSTTWSFLKKSLAPKNNDVVILCGAQDEVSARLGALAAAITLL